MCTELKIIWKSDAVINEEIEIFWKYFNSSFFNEIMTKSEEVKIIIISSKTNAKSYDTRVTRI